jgi:hypothetical protein
MGTIRFETAGPRQALATVLACNADGAGGEEEAA